MGPAVTLVKVTWADSSMDRTSIPAMSQAAGAKADVTLGKPVTTRYLVVWLTKLPAIDGNYVGQVSEIVVR